MGAAKPSLSIDCRKINQAGPYDSYLASCSFTSYVILSVYMFPLLFSKIHIFPFQMVFEKLLEEFAKENFGDQEGNFFPVSHDRNQEIKLFALLVKERRPISAIWERPLKLNKLTILAGLGDYIVEGKKKDFLEGLNKHIKKEDHGMELEEENGDDNGATR